MKIQLRREYEEALSCFKQGNFEIAKKLLDSLFKKSKNDENILKLGYAIYKRLGDENKALEYIYRLYLLDPSNHFKCFSLVEELLKDRQYEKAKNVLLIFLKNNKKFQEDALVRLANIAKDNLKYGEAIQYLLEAAKFKGKHYKEILFELALLNAELRHEDEAITLFEKLLSIDLKHEKAAFNVATLYHAKGDFKKAERIYMDVHSTSGYIEPLVRAAYTRKIISKDDIVYTKVTELLSKNPSDQEKESLYYAKGKCLEDMKLYGEALHHYRLANQLNRNRIGPFDYEGYCSLFNFIRSKFPSKDAPFKDISFNKNPIFIVGHFRSGSTLLEQMLASHSKIKGLGELDLILKTTNYPNAPLLSDTKLIGQIQHNYQELINDINFQEPYFIDKRPENIWLIGYIKNMFPKSKFIFTSRNIIDNALSVYFNQLNDLSTYSTALINFKKYDTLIQSLYHFWKGIYPNDIIKISYEDIVTAPRTSVKSIIEFLGLSWEDSCLEFNKNSSFIRTASVNQARNPLYRTSLQKHLIYLKYFTKEELQAFHLEDKDVN